MIYIHSSCNSQKVLTLLYTYTNKMQTATLILALFLASANAGNIMDLIVDESQGGDIIAIDISGKHRKPL